MIVNVKGTRAGQDDGDLPSRQRYLTKEKKPSKAPFAVGAFLFGIAAYLKSALPSRAEPASDDSAPDAEPEAARPRLKLVENEMRAAELIATDAENSTGTLQDAEHAFHRIGSGSLLDERLPSARFLMVDSPSINYSDFSMPRTDVSDLAAFQPALTVANDNIPSSGGSSGGGGQSSLDAVEELRAGQAAGVPVHGRRTMMMMRTDGRVGRAPRTMTLMTMRTTRTTTTGRRARTARFILPMSSVAERS